MRAVNKGMQRMPVFYSVGLDTVDDPSAITVTSTSASSGDATPVNLREPTDLTRLRFEPKIVKNDKEPQNSIEGTFVYERKGKNDDSFPSERGEDFLSKGSLNASDTLRFSLSSSETRALYDALTNLYQIADDMGGMPLGTSQYVAVDNAARTLLKMLRHNPSATHMIADKDTFELVQELLKLLSSGMERDELHRVLEDLEDFNLQSLSVSMNAERLRRVRDEFAANLSNTSEGYWQKFFEANAWVISQVFSLPCTLYESQAYAGGKSLGNRGGNLPDFLYQNKLTKNLAIVEIKRPDTPLLGKPYRGESYSVSEELSGAVNQVLSYRQTLLKEFNSLYVNSGGGIEAFSPQCVVVIGATGQLDTRTKKSSFENFRNSLNGITILTYDELLAKLDDIIGILSIEESDSSQNIESSSPCHDEIPF